MTKITKSSFIMVACIIKRPPILISRVSYSLATCDLEYGQTEPKIERYKSNFKFSFLQEPENYICLSWSVLGGQKSFWVSIFSFFIVFSTLWRIFLPSLRSGKKIPPKCLENNKKRKNLASKAFLPSKYSSAKT